MTHRLQLVTIGTLIPGVLAAQTGAFVVRLGNDTLAVEQYARTADRQRIVLRGEQVVRSPRTQHRIYTATFGAGGAGERFELVTHNVSAGPGPAETKATMEFAGDSAVVQVRRGDSVATQRIKLGPGGLPYFGQGFALVEEVTRRARAAGGDRYTTAMLPLGEDEPWKVRSEEHTSELQSREKLVCRLLLEKKKFGVVVMVDGHHEVIVKSHHGTSSRHSRPHLFLEPFVQHMVQVYFFFFNDTATTEIYTLSLHDALPIYLLDRVLVKLGQPPFDAVAVQP